MHHAALIGRDTDLALALEQLKRVERGGSGCILIRGEAGIGKTRLATEVLAQAETAGHRTLVGRADEFDSGIPYAVLRDVLARLQVPDVRGPVRARLEELRQGLDAGVTGAPADAHLSLVFARAVDLFRALTAGGRTVLLVEDAHLADADSLALLALLARLAELSMLTLVTLRPVPSGPARELEGLLERMAYDGRGAVIDLEPLDRDEIGELVGAALGADPDARVVDETLARSAGNPFFAFESVRTLHDAGALRVEQGRAHLAGAALAPGLARNAPLLGRVFGSGAETLELAKVVAAFGRFSLRHLPLAARLVDWDEATVTGTFDALVHDHVLARDPDGGYSFVHGIVRDAVYDEIGPAERRRLHGAIAQELARDRRVGTLVDIAELATHVAESADPGEEAAIDVLLEAARAVGTTAPLVSAEHYRRAVELLPADSPRRAEALALRARALHIGSRPLEAVAAGREALEGLAPGPHRRATTALVINGLNIAGHVAEALAVVESALSAGADACPLRAQQVHLLLSSGRPDEAAELLPEALASLEGAPPTAQLIAATHLMIYATDSGRQAIANELTARLEAWAQEGPAPRRIQAHEAIAFADRRPGIVATMERHLEAAAALRADHALPSIGGHHQVAVAHLELLRGDWDAALEICGSAGFELEQQGAKVGAALLRLMECEVLSICGNVDKAGALLRELDVPLEELRSQQILCQARVVRAMGDAEAARALLAGQAERSERTTTVLSRAALLTELAELLVELGSDEDARAIAEEVESLAVSPCRHEWPLAALHLRARLWGDVDAARAYLELAGRERIEFERARAELVLGELDEDPFEHLTGAYRAFDALGAGPWRRRAASALRARQLTVPRPAQRLGGTLTDTEGQLVRLVAEGLTNRQIASALHYSPKTIEVYLSRVYAKTGCASRIELIRALDSGALELPVQA